MEILIIAVIVLIVAGILIYAVQRTPPLAPFAWMIEVLILIIAVLVILDKSGLIT